MELDRVAALLRSDQQAMNIYFYFALLALVSGYAFLRGGREERIVAAVCVTASLASLAIFRPVDVSYSDFQPKIALIDFAVLAAFVSVALKTQRFWPLWVAGTQLTTTIGHVLKLLDPELLPVVYGAALASWSYLHLLILATGTWRAHRDVNAHQELRA
jgi:hypothetical protein